MPKNIVIFSDGTAVPRHGPRLRKIASDAVNYVYNHGNGFPRGQQPYLDRREVLGRRFRRKYGSFVPDAKKDVQGNVQPKFVGVFDTVAALGNVLVGFAVAGAFAGLCRSSPDLPGQDVRTGLGQPGSRIVATSPPSGALASVISPPWARMTLRAIASPSPAPPVSRLRELSYR